MLNIYSRPPALRKLAVLGNCKDHVELEKLNAVSELTFALPADDPKLRHCEPFNLVRWKDGAYYRLLDRVADENGETDPANFQCEHCIATLIDDVIFGAMQLDNLTTRQVIEWILNRQITKHWRLGDCDFNRWFSYSWSNENLLAALFSVPNRFDEDYQWTYDMSTYPWTVNLKRLDQSKNPQYYIRKGKNLIGSTKTTKGRDICTVLYALGYGEGVNQLTFAELNGGKPYIEAPPEIIEKYGRITRIWEDRRFTLPQSLLDRARVLLDAYSNPRDSYVANVADLEKKTGEPIDRAEVGKITWLEGVKTYVTQVERHLADVGADVVELANTPEDIAGSIADLADRQRINGVYAQGATNIYAMTWNDNADQAHPAALKFYVPSEARNINKVLLTWSLEQFRSYETGASTAPATAQSTRSGGGSAVTSASGGGGSVTSGPSSRQTTGTIDRDDYTELNTDFENTYSSGHHDHPFRFFTLPHGHQMDHAHSVSTDPHTHSVNTPDHAHDFTIPAHAHDIEYGIYEGPRASSITLRVDGKNIPLASGQAEIDVAAMLGTDSSGRISRGTHHTIEIIPNTLTRITATLTVQLFIQSEGGGNF